MLPIGMPPPKQQKNKAVPANQMDKQQLKSNLLCRTVFQQKKRAEEQANGMDVCNATLEQLSYKVR